MKRLQEREWAYKGEITAFLALIFILMLSLVGALVESASVQIAKNRKRADVMLALESAFAEYDSEMLKQYELFVRLGSGENTLKDRLEFYGASNMTHTLVRAELLTDNSGTPFYRQVVRYMKHWLGIEDLSFGSEYDFSSDSDPEEEERQVSQELESLLEQEEAELSEENNPLPSVQNLKNSPLLSIVAPNPEELSDRSIAIETLPSARSLNRGNYGRQEEIGASDKLFFVAYITSHFSNMTAGSDAEEGTDVTESDARRTLLYEQEYLLGGHPGDKENLEAVCKKILNIRMAVNYVYLLTDSAKKAEAETVAAAICSLLSVPAITELVKHALLLAWAYGESVVDVRALLKQKKVPLIKTEETWQLQLSNLSKLGTSGEAVGEKEAESGFSYEDYLKGLLLAESRETLCMRSLDLIESNLQIKTDQCMTAAEIESKVKLRRGIQDTFLTAFQYQ